MFFPIFLCTAFMISTNGIIEKARARATRYSFRSMDSKPNSPLSAGMKITAEVRRRESIIVPNRSILCVLRRKMESCERIL